MERAVVLRRRLYATGLASLGCKKREATEEDICSSGGEREEWMVTRRRKKLEGKNTKKHKANDRSRRGLPRGVCKKRTWVGCSSSAGSKYVDDRIGDGMKGERKRLGPSCGRMTSIHIAPDGKEPIAGRKCGLGGHRGLDLQCLASSLAGASRGGRGGPLPLAIILPCILCTVPGMCESARTVQDGRHGAAAQWRHAEYSVRTGPERPRAGHARTRTPAGLSAVSQIFGRRAA